jgi:hypothetical protein
VSRLRTSSSGPSRTATLPRRPFLPPRPRTIPTPTLARGSPADTPVQWWRINARDVWWHQITLMTGMGLLAGADRTVSDFLGAYVDLRAMRKDRGSFNQFFLFDIEAWNVPRLWWQGTVEVMQLGTKLGRGNPVDAAIGRCVRVHKSGTRHSADVSAARTSGEISFRAMVSPYAHRVRSDRSRPHVRRRASIGRPGAGSGYV